MKIVLFKKSSRSLLNLIPYPTLIRNKEMWNWIINGKPITLTIETGHKGKKK